MKLTGERPIEGRTPPSLLALHEAGHREVRARLGAGRVVDVGCGLGDGSASFLRADREVIGIDYDPTTAVLATRTHRGLLTACADGARLPLRAASADWVCSSHLAEHFHDPAAHLAELARVVRPDGTAFVVTPNAPADFENPYHVHLFEPDDLAGMLRRFFDDVEVLGLDGDAAVRADFARRRVLAARLLRLDPLGLRHRLPRSWYVALHAGGRRALYPVLAWRDRRAAARGEAPAVIGAERFGLTATIDRETLVLFAIARRPRHGAGDPSGHQPA